MREKLYSGVWARNQCKLSPVSIRAPEIRPPGHPTSISPTSISTASSPPDRLQAFVVAVSYILGISAHSLFESIALGLSSDFSTVLNVFIATAAHRWATSIAIAFTVAAELAYLPFLIVFGLFSVMVPIDVVLGAALQSLNHTMQEVLFALSADTFLYIGAFEGMVDEFVAHRKWHFRKFLSTVLGEIIIIVVTGILVALDIMVDHRRTKKHVQCRQYPSLLSPPNREGQGKGQGRGQDTAPRPYTTPSNEQRRHRSVRHIFQHFRGT